MSGIMFDVHVQRRPASVLYEIAAVDSVEQGSLYVLHNKLHTRPFGLFMKSKASNEHTRSMLREAVAKARARACYKLIGTTSDERLQQAYVRRGFAPAGREFRLDFPE